MCHFPSHLYFSLSSVSNLVSAEDDSIKISHAKWLEARSNFLTTLHERPRQMESSSRSLDLQSSYVS